MPLLESLAYAFARGAVRAYLDVIRESDTAVEEAPIVADDMRARRFRSAVARVSTPSSRDSGPAHTPSHSD
jgi:hypothetical protein